MIFIVFQQDNKKARTLYVLAFMDFSELYQIVLWCSERDSNSHILWTLPPQDSVSTNSTIRAKLYLLRDVVILCFNFRWLCNILFYIT